MPASMLITTFPFPLLLTWAVKEHGNGCREIEIEIEQRYVGEGIEKIDMAGYLTQHKYRTKL